MGAILKTVTVLGIVALFIVGIALLMAFPMMLLLNYLLSDTAMLAVFGAPEIGFWKAMWLNVFLAIFIKASRSTCNCSK